MAVQVKEHHRLNYLKKRPAQSLNGVVGVFYEVLSRLNSAG